MTFSLPAARRPGVQPSYADQKLYARQIAAAVNNLNQGHLNCTIFVTLDPNEAATVVTDSRISPQTVASFQAQTASAAAELPTLYTVCTDGSLTINHTNSATTDRTYSMGILG